MRTTVRIDDDLLAELKRRAGDDSLTSVLNETLRRGLAAEDETKLKQVKEFRQRTFSLGKPLYDVNKALSLADQWDDEERLRRMMNHQIPERNDGE